MERKVLGKGLDALIPQRPDRGQKNFVHLSVDQIMPSPYQPRKEIDKAELDELSQSIKEKGIIQPIVVRKVGKKYEVVAGHRRFEASKSLGLKELPTVVRELDDQEAFLLALIENIQRKDLNPIEEAYAFKRLSEEFNLTYDEVAQFVGKDKTSIANTLRLLKLPQEIKAALQKGIITRTQARTILGLEKEEDQKKMLYTILSEKLSVREIEEKVRKASPHRRKKTDPFIAELEERFQQSLGTKVKIRNKKNNSGKIVIEYYNLNDLERITKKL